MGLFSRKPIEQLLNETGETGTTLKRTLTAGALIALGIGAIIGAGIFVRTANAAGGHAGSAVTLSFVIAGIGCALAGLCYAEFAAMIPIAGSAYTYTYTTMGELVAWIIGWDLVLEYALGAATVSIGWSQYLTELMHKVFHMEVPYQWSHSPLMISESGVHGIINLPAVAILLLMTLLLIRGTQSSATVNNIIVILKMTIVILFICLGWQFINPANHTPYMISASTPDVKLNVIDPTTGLNMVHRYSDFWNHGWGGVLKGAGIVFFAFIGFDAVSTAAQEAINPKRDMPKGILVSLAICTVLYILFSHVLTGLAPFPVFLQQGGEASVSYVVNHYMPASYSWLSTFVTVSILFGFTSVILVMLLGQTRVFYTMAKDGLVPAVFAKLHPKHRTPYKSQWLFFVFVGLFAAFIPDSIVGNMTSIGTLFAFVLVCIGVMILRKRSPEIPRSFRTPLVPLVPVAGALICLAMIAGLGIENWLRLIIWLVIGMVVYFGYSKKHSKVQRELKS
jgi:basic amino acid/polyamine antiporter, APA family